MESCSSACKQTAQRAVNSAISGSQPLCRVLVLGLDAAGKTTLLNKIKNPTGSVDWVVTNDCCVERLASNNTELLAWDLGGVCQIIPGGYDTWRLLLAWFTSSMASIKTEGAADELHALFKYEQIRDVKILVLVNKHDKPACMATREVYAKLNLDSMARSRVHIQGVSTVQGEVCRKDLTSSATPPFG